ncbi:MAG: T9SS type A sorting domain-containing protein [Cytophagales bacterium]|nr:T9SS type A sorting domain-containing protein [Cytophagales bacterium]
MVKLYYCRTAVPVHRSWFKSQYLSAVLLLLLVSTYGRAQDNLQNGLIACYAFSGSASDGSGNNNNGTLYGPIPTTDRFGNPNGAYQFDGVNDYIALPEANLKTANYTYSMWLKAASLPAALELYAALSIGGPGADQGLTLANNYVGSTGWAGVSYNSDGTVTPSNSVGSLPTANTWYHVVQTRSNAFVNLYVNGTLIGSRATNGTTPKYNYSAPGATIGSRSNLTQFFHGAIDDVRLYNRAVTAPEVSALYTTNVACQPLAVDLQAGLIGCYPFTGNANDASSSSNNGTVYGATPATDRFGNANSAYRFDGVDDYIELNASILDNPNYTYAAWVKVGSLPTYNSAYMILSVGGQGADQNLAIANMYSASQSTGWAISTYTTQGNVVGYHTNVMPAAATWAHVVSVRSNNTLSLYINGQLAGSATTGGLLPGYNTPMRAVIGSRSHALSQHFPGTIDDVALYNRALNAAEVAALFNGSACQATPAPVPMPVAANVARCGRGTVTLTASGGSQYRWYASASGDTLLHTGASFTTPVLTATTKYYVTNVVNGRESARKEVSAIVSPMPEAPVAADTSRCGNGTVTLTASGCHNYRWYDAQGTLLSSGLTFTTPELSKTTTFYVSGVHNDCEGPRTAVKVTVHLLPSTPLVTASGPTAFCVGDSLVLSATPGCAAYLWSTGETSQSIVVREPGSYSVKTSNYVCNSCDRYTCESLPSKPVVVKVHALPAAPEIVQVCADTLRAVPAGKVFAWYRDGVLLPFTSRSILAEQTGSYTVKVRDTNGCFSEQSASYAFMLEPACFTVYPNPNQGNFNVKVNGNHKVLKLEIVTLREGKLLWKTDLPKAECRLNVSINLVLPKGIYLVKLHTRKGVFHQRVQIL